MERAAEEAEDEDEATLRVERVEARAVASAEEEAAATAKRSLFQRTDEQSSSSTSSTPAAAPVSAASVGANPIKPPPVLELKPSPPLTPLSSTYASPLKRPGSSNEDSRAAAAAIASVVADGELALHYTRPNGGARSAPTLPSPTTFCGDSQGPSPLRLQEAPPLTALYAVSPPQLLRNGSSSARKDHGSAGAGSSTTTPQIDALQKIVQRAELILSGGGAKAPQVPGAEPASDVLPGQIVSGMQHSPSVKRLLATASRF